MFDLSYANLQKYFNGLNRHNSYTKTTTLYNDLRIHFDGTMPEKLIDQYRPNESKNIKEYRVANHKAKTKGTCNKIISSLSKIRRSQDWSIAYDPKEMPAEIKSEETLQKYCENNYPKHGSITNWMFSVGLKSYLVDANAIVIVVPNNPDAPQGEYLRPEAFIFNSDKVVGFKEDEYCILEGVSKEEYNSQGFFLRFQKVFWVIDNERVQLYEQINGGADYELAQDYEHHLGRLPAFKVRGLFKETIDRDTIWESRLSSILPDLDQALMIFSDFIAELVQHVHSEKWQYSSNNCQTCNGTGKYIKKQIGLSTKIETLDCPTCNGGKITASPYGNHIINMAVLKDYAGLGLPTPPVGYLTKDTAMITELDRLIDKFIYCGLSAINMEFLAETPLNESGKAKEVDKDELNNFVHSVAEDIVYVMERIYALIADYRYTGLVADPMKRKKLLPKINVPEKFDLLGSQYFVDEYQKLKNAGISQTILINLEIELAAKKFYNNPEIASKVRSIYELDPLPAFNNDEKMVMLQNKGITYRDYVVSCYISSFVDRAIAENQPAENTKGFLQMDLEEKTVIINSYADEKIKEMSVAEKLKKELFPTPDTNLPSVVIPGSAHGTTGN